MKKSQDVCEEIVYEEVMTITTPFLKAKVIRPVLTEAERERRQRELVRATERFVAEAIRVGAL